ncbi:putative Splicing factor U2AF-associated protein 2 [Blattamonas nauphoetae]|uniref:Splicing factor U2AF-associated protein 2 n=1 Tax=Blattamonas nauphoetae TaxID=2049346 RepID=A0ABQ9YF86_9EUKA|nr:putative Splicing factor U2AF-associated protein 2 [Blattamonas nauphoetae]
MILPPEEDAQLIQDRIKKYYQNYTEEERIQRRQIIEEEKSKKTPEELAEEKKRKREWKKQKKQVNPKLPQQSQKSDKLAVFASGFPKDANRADIIQFFSLVSMLKHNADGSECIKMYQDKETSAFRGEVLAIYPDEAAVELAIMRLDNSYFPLGAQPSSGHLIHVELAHFDSKPQQSKPKQQPVKPKGSNDSIREIRKRESKARGWNLADTTASMFDPQVAIEIIPKSFRTVVLKNMFSVDDFSKVVNLKDELREDIELEAIKIGEVEKVTVYDRHPLGIITIRFKQQADAQKALSVFNGRHFDGRQVVAEIERKETSPEVLNLQSMFLPHKLDDDNSDSEEERLAAFARDLEKEKEDSEAEMKGIKRQRVDSSDQPPLPPPVAPQTITLEEILALNAAKAEQSSSDED